MRQDWINLIRALAPQYGVDPQAALAVSSVEGLSGGVGDQGTSFGPFQLHEGGALPRGRGRQWAESGAGIRYALEQMSKVARGKRGRKAVEAIVSGFERPADPTSEVRNATNALASFRPGPRGAKFNELPNATGTTQWGNLPNAPARGGMSGVAKQMILRSIASGDAIDFGALAQANQRANQAPRNPNRMTPDAPQSPTRGASRPIHGKIIGTPHKGTHTLGNWESDNAVDVSMPIGSPIYAPMAGTIGKQFGSLGKSGRFEGIRMHLLSPQDELYLAHLSRVAKGIHPGSHVAAGELLGYSGEASGVPHLHLGSRDDRAGSYVS